MIIYSLVIPVYNSVESLTELVSRIAQVFENSIKQPYEIIFIDDASTNKRTWPLIEELVKKHSHIKGVQLMRNFGKNGALMAGFEEVKGLYVITLDDDLQHRPEDIPNLIREKEHDIVIGMFGNKEHSFFKKTVSRLNGWFEKKLIHKPAHIKSGPYRLLKAEVVKAMLNIRTPYPSIPALMYYVSRDVVNVEVQHDRRTYNKSEFTLGKMWKTFSNLLINNSSFLLKVIAFIGITISLLSFILGIYFIIKKLTVGTSVQGWASLMVTLLFIGGLILFSLGVVGEYLLRIINGIERKPSYLIRKKISK